MIKDVCLVCKACDGKILNPPCDQSRRPGNFIAGDQVVYSWKDRFHNRHKITVTLTRVTKKTGFWLTGVGEESGRFKNMKLKS